MGSELMRIAEGFSIVAEGLRGLAKAEGGTKEKAVKEQKQDTAKAQQESVAQEQQEQPATLEGMTIVAGHQRATVLTDLGYEEIDCIGIDMVDFS